MHLWLTPSQAKTIVQQARTGAPNEICGVIGGRNGRALEIIPITNVAPNPTNHYTFDASEQAVAMSRLHNAGSDLTAIYHSHPNSSPVPSQTDIRNATYPNTIYLIIGLQQESADFAAWQIAHGEVRRVPLFISTTPPEVEPTNLTAPQKVAIILTGIIAAAAVITYAIYLLPPAPPIPTPGG